MKCEKCGHDDTKIKLLKNEIKELNEEIKLAKAEFELSSRFMEIAKGMDRSSKQNFQIYNQISKEHIARELESLRLNIEKIRKISPDAADTLNIIIKHYEDSHKMLRELAEKYRDDKAGDLTVLQFLVFMISFGGIMQKVHESVEACSLAIRDAAKRLE